MDLDKNISSQSSDSSEVSVTDIDLSSIELSRSEDIYLNVFVNGDMRSDMYPFRQKEDGTFIIHRNELEAIGIAPTKGAIFKKEKGEEWIDIAALTAVESVYDEERNAILFTTNSLDALLPYRLNVSSLRSAHKIKTFDEQKELRSDLAVLANYNIYLHSSATDFKDIARFDGMSNMVETRLLSKLGALSSTYLLDIIPAQEKKFYVKRIDTHWSYSNLETALTFQFGDLVTRSLPWNHSVRLGGIQIRRNFDLRPDLITVALPTMAHSVTVPSVLDLYINNTKYFTESVPAGRFSLENMPVISGYNQARLVIKDIQGRETVTHASFFNSSALLADGLLDFSLEAGFPRRFYGGDSQTYETIPFILGTSRYGWKNQLTLENHMELGKNFYNGGLGISAPVGGLGLLSLSGSMSRYQHWSGQQFTAGIDFYRSNVSFTARTQRFFGEYHDIGSVMEKQFHLKNSLEHSNKEIDFLKNFQGNDLQKDRTRFINQVSLGFPMIFDPANINITYTEQKMLSGNVDRYLGFSYSRTIGKNALFYVNGFKSFREPQFYSLYGGIAININNEYSISHYVNHDNSGSYISSTVKRQMGGEIGDYGWTVENASGDRDNRHVSGTYRSSFAIVSAGLEQYNKGYSMRVNIDGSLIFADKSLMLSNKVHDAFAVLNVGVPNVKVLHHNVFYGTTGRNGKIVIPNLISFQENHLSIDVESLPLDTLMTGTELLVIPGYRGAVIETFGAMTADNYVFLSLKDTTGNFIEVGSYATIQGTEKGFDIAYDGIGIFPTGTFQYPVTLIVQRPDNQFCRAQFQLPEKRKMTENAIELICLPIVALERNDSV